MPGEISIGYRASEFDRQFRGVLALLQTAGGRREKNGDQLRDLTLSAPTLEYSPEQDRYGYGKGRKQRAEHAAFQFRGLALLPTSSNRIFDKRRIIRHDEFLPGRPELQHQTTRV